MVRVRVSNRPGGWDDIGWGAVHKGSGSSGGVIVAAKRPLRATTAKPTAKPPAECRHGHPRTPETTYFTLDGDRICRPCRTLSLARYRRRKANMCAYLTQERAVR